MKVKSVNQSIIENIFTLVLLLLCSWTLTKRMEKKHDGNYTRMLRAILNKTWRQRPTKPQLYSYLPTITKTITVKRTRHAGHCWRNRAEFIIDVLLWTPAYARAKAGRPARTYIQQLCDDTECSLQDLPEEMNDREEWRERVKDIRAGGTTWGWWRFSLLKGYHGIIQIFLQKNLFIWIKYRYWHETEYMSTNI